MDLELRKKVKEYIATEYSRGFSYNAIEKVLLERGYSKGEIDGIINELNKEPTGKRLMRGLPFVLISLLIIIGVIAFIVFYAGPMSSKACETQDCFVKLADECKQAKYIVDDEGTVYEYKSFGDCTFTKNIAEVSKNEPDSIRELFNKKSLKCSYEKNSFDKRWLTTLLGGLDRCNGPLKEALYELTIAQYKQEIGTV